MQKFRAITDQLKSDFTGLRKDGEIFVVWVAEPKPGADTADPNSYERFDRIMFFTNGDFQSYGTNPKVIRGNLARVSYMLAKRGGIGGVKAENQLREKRILARTQHIYTDDNFLDNYLDPANGFTGTNDQWGYWNNRLEYDKTTLEQWKNILWEEPPTPCKKDMLTVIADVTVDESTIPDVARGANVEPADANTIHMLLCEGVGEFKIQGWYDKRQRWVPEIDPDGDGDLSNSDFFLDGKHVPGVLYSVPPYSGVNLSGEFSGDSFQELLNEEDFNLIPGLGRALKFTFTLYDSKGVIKNGRTFTYIVYLGD